MEKGLKGLFHGMSVWQHHANPISSWNGNTWGQTYSFLSFYWRAGFLKIILHNVSITLVGSTISPALLNNLNASIGKNGFIFKNTDFDFWFEVSNFNLNFVGINTIWLITPKILTLLWSVCSVTSLRALWNHGGVVYLLDGCQTVEQEEGFNKSFLTLTLQKQIPMSICVRSATSACANIAGQNSHRYLSVTSFTNKQKFATGISRQSHWDMQGWRKMHFVYSNNC